MLRIVTLTVFLALSFSCTRIAPAGFWEDFKSDLVTGSSNDHGPWGGHRIMNWASESTSTFSSKEIIAFALEHGWEMVDSLTLNEGGVDAFLMRDDHLNITAEITGKSKAYVFKTGWIVVDPGTDETNDVNGFVVINETGTEMLVYHLWGE
jgi:hypothetical protein